MATHRLDAAPDTVHWGFFDAALKPLMTIDSGDTVTISTVSGSPPQMPKPWSGTTKGEGGIASGPPDTVAIVT